MILEAVNKIKSGLNTRFCRVPIEHYAAISSLQLMMKEAGDEPTNTELRELWTILRNPLDAGLSGPGR